MLLPGKLDLSSGVMADVNCENRTILFSECRLGRHNLDTVLDVQCFG